MNDCHKQSPTRSLNCSLSDCYMKQNKFLPCSSTDIYNFLVSVTYVTPKYYASYFNVLGFYIYPINKISNVLSIWNILVASFPSKEIVWVKLVFYCVIYSTWMTPPKQNVLWTTVLKSKKKKKSETMKLKILQYAIFYDLDISPESEFYLA